MNVNRTIIVTSANAPLARTLGTTLTPGGVNMFETPLYTGAIITHYVSSGWINSDYDVMLTDANALFNACGGVATLLQCQTLVNTSTVVDCDSESAYDTFARLGLTIN